MGFLYPQTNSLVVSRSRRDRFYAFHRNNPGVYREIERRALLATKGGTEGSVSVRELVKEIRRDSTMDHLGINRRINQNYAAWYARMLDRSNRRLEGRVRMQAMRRAVRPRWDLMGRDHGK